MSSAPPPSPLESPDRRRRLQQQYEQAQRLAGGSPPDFRRIHELLADCLREDPGEVLYLDALLANIRRWGPKEPSWWQRWTKSWRGPAAAKRSAAPHGPNPALSTEYLVPSTEIAIDMLRRAPDILLANLADPAALRQLAAACEACDLPEAELWYLRTAREANPADCETLEMLARSLTRQGRFTEAREVWQHVSEQSPGHSEALQALADLQPPTQPPEVVFGNLQERIAAVPTDVSAYLELASVQTNATQFRDAEAVLTAAQGACGGDLRIHEAREQLQLAQSQHQLALARRRAISDPYPRAQQLVSRLEAEHNRLEIDIFNLRCERLPRDMRLRVELARRLKRAGNFSGAVQRLEEARRDPDLAAEALLELGECWQHLRQFAKALDFYRQAAAEGGPQVTLAASYRRGVLAAAMNNPAEAREAFSRVLAIDPAYKDARQRLDKLP